MGDDKTERPTRKNDRKMVFICWSE